MNTSINPPAPDLLRHLPRRFSWIDHRLLRDGHLAACRSTKALALYLLLLTAADPRGLSYYSDKRLAQLLALSEPDIRQARQQLIDNRLIAWRSPYSQILSLDPDDIQRARRLAAHQQSQRVGDAISLQQALKQLASQLPVQSSDHTSQQP